MNKLLKTLVFNNEISLSVLDTTEMVNKAMEIHKLTPLAAAALGRTMTVCTFMSSNLKNRGDKLSVTVKGDGVGGKITVCGNGHLQMRGSIDNPYADLPLRADGKLDVGGCVGKNGRITVVKSMGLKEPYSGSSALVTGEIAEDFTAYYAYSEQQPTAMAIGVLIGRDETCIGAGGIIIQPMPNCSDESIDKAEKLISQFGDVSAKINAIGAEGIIKEYFAEYDFTEYNPKYVCNCSKEYIDGILLTLGEEELYDTVEKEGKIEVCCHFCDKKYVYYKEDVDKLLGK
jgi:molecular chaperone Hsp33